MLEAKGLCAGYPGRQVLKNLELKIPAGKVTVLLGPNGCGKSTLLKALCGILPVSGGQVLLNGENILALQSREQARKMAYLAQSRQVPDITAYRLVLHGRFPHLGYPRRYRSRDHAIARKAMEQMGIGDLADTLMEQLSGGQRQKVYIAMALAQDTPVMLLDEPSTYLDISHQLQLMRQAKDLAEQGKTVVMILHDLSHALQTADEVILMQEGTLVCQGSPEQIYDTGTIDRVFGITLRRTQTASGWRYYCEEGKA